MPKKLDIKPGDRYGHWTVLSTDYHLNSGGSLSSLCQCDCGRTRYVRNSYLVKGVITDCGCQRNKHLLDARGQKLSATRLYHIWYGMVLRCDNPKATGYKNYGGKGIRVCDEWHDDFLAFREWALSHGYTDELTIDRIDSNGNYCPENCRWATVREQQNNRTVNRHITFNGRTQTTSEWAMEYGLRESTLWNRVFLYGWSIERALTEPVDVTRRPHKSAV